MRRRDFIALAAVAAVLPGTAIRARSEALKRIGWLTVAPHHFIDAFRLGLRDAGYVEEKDITIVYRYADGVNERLPALARELASGAADIVVASGSAAAQAARREIKTMPVVFVTTNVVELGLVASLAHPGGNMTGVDLDFHEVTSKWPEFMLELLPGARRFAVIAGNDQASRTQAKSIQATAASLGRETFVIIADDLDFERHFDEIARRGADGVMVTSTPNLDRGILELIRIANARRIPTLYQNRDWPQAGGLISYGANLELVFRRAALVVDKILRGQAPATIPVEQPTKFELVVNLKTAKALGLTIPPSILARADEVIE